MEYSIQTLSKLSGISTRTLRWYHEKQLLLPKYVGENGYRYYGEDEINRLQQILLYREMGVSLTLIAQLLDSPDHSRLNTLKEHLAALNEEQKRIHALMKTVHRTIDSIERNEMMTDKEKFEAFKRNSIEKNERLYGKEIREKYGNETIDKANAHTLHLTQAEWEEWTEIKDAISARLIQAIKNGTSPLSAEGNEIALLHKKWLSFTNKNYSTEMHHVLANMYLSDTRFQSFYDEEHDGCAEFLKTAIHAWI